MAIALYAYSPTDAGDLALQQNDRIQVIEHMNNDCKHELIFNEFNSVLTISRVAWSE